MLQLSSSLEENLAALNARFGDSADFYAKRIELYHCPGAIVLFDNMASLESLWSLLLDAATRHTPSLEPERMPHSGTQVYELLMHHSGLPAEDSPVKDMDDLIRRMTAGMAVLLLDGCKKGLVFSVQGLKSRSVEEPPGKETSVAPGRLCRPAAGQPEFTAPPHPYRHSRDGDSTGRLCHEDRICHLLLQRQGQQDGGGAGAPDAPGGKAGGPAGFQLLCTVAFSGQVAAVCPSELYRASGFRRCKAL